MPSTEKTVAVLLVAALLAIAGCGSQGVPDGTYSVRASTTVIPNNISKVRFITRVSLICRRALRPVRRNVAARMRERAALGKRASFPDAVRVPLLAGIDFYIFDEIRDLGAPQGEAREVEAIIGRMQSAVERGQEGLAPVGSIAEVSRLFADYNRRARAYGLGECLFDETGLRRFGL